MKFAWNWTLPLGILAFTLGAPAGAQDRQGSLDSTATNLSAGQSQVAPDAVADIVALQDLTAIVTNNGPSGAGFIQDGVNMRFRTGDSSIGNNAFGGFSGILTQNLNSGVNSISQAATNVAATGLTAAQRL